ncbi:unnamed protein product [Oppiella nova]|uniref:ABC-2 type transporter transmembrane domain-containing protein n=1 Tax=Oppiella nova TaxID=334625 RepID=A0A7R9QCV5_9ACAR|nr:unnamed protein product [Oppiella nova]CAG2162435.1 unnamed protein product [Oppiella nova]
MAVGLTALTLGSEKKSGLMDRSLVAGLRLHEILTAQIALQFLIIILQTIILMIVTFLVFELPNNGNNLYTLLIILLQGICGMPSGGFYI